MKGAARVAGAAMILFAAGCAPRGNAPIPGRVTAEAGDWRIRAVDGEPMRLGAFAGRPVVVNFWATWCAPCVRELSSFERLVTALSGTDIAFVFVTAENDERVRRFARRNRLNLPFYVEMQDAPSSLGVRALPTTIVIDRNGRIILHHRGALAWDDPAIVARLRELAGS